MDQGVVGVFRGVSARTRTVGGRRSAIDETVVAGVSETDRGCAASEFKCPQDGLCIRQNQLCDGVSDCVGGDDEANCEYRALCSCVVYSRLFDVELDESPG